MAGITPALRRASECVEDFRGDYGELAAMMQASWGEGPDPPYLYTAELLADHFRYPGSSFALAPSVYDGAEIVAFVAGYPRRIIAGAAERRILISTFLTVAPAQKASGYGLVVWSDLMRRAADAGFDGVINYCVDGEAMHRMIEASCRLLDLPLVRVRSFSYLVKPLAGPSGREAGTADPSAAELMSAARRLTGRTGLCRQWSEAEAGWQLSRLGAVSIRAGTDSAPAILTGNVIAVADAERTPCLVIDDVLWGDLEKRARQELALGLIERAARAGARLAIVPVLGYADLRPFVVAGFVPSPHTIHAYLTLWSGPTPDAPMEHFYLDVI